MNKLHPTGKIAKGRHENVLAYPKQNQFFLRQHVVSTHFQHLQVPCMVAHRDKTPPRIQNTSQNPKHFPESKTLPRIQKHFTKSKSTSQNPKTLFTLQNTSQNTGFETVVSPHSLRRRDTGFE